MKNLKYFNDKDPWILAENIPDCYFYFCQIWLSSFGNDLEKSCGKNYKKIIAVFHDTNMSFYYGEKNSREVEEYLVNKITKNPKFGEDINKNIYLHSDRLSDYAKRLSLIDVNELSNQEICNLLDEQDKIHTELYEWGWLSNATDMFHATFTNTLNKYLLCLTNDEMLANEYLQILSNPDDKSVINKQEEEFLELIVEVQKNHPNIDKINLDDLLNIEEEMIKKYWQKYHYMKFLWIGRDGVYSIDDYLKEINDFLENGFDANKKIRGLNQEIQRKRDEKIELFKKINLPKKWQRIFNVYAEFMLTKAYRREAQIYWGYQFHKLLNEIAKRLDISLKQVYVMLMQEIKIALVNKKLDKNELNNRLRLFVYYVEKDQEIIFTGKEAKQIEESLQTEVDEEICELKGQIGCAGFGKGIVKIINDPTQLSKM